MPEISIIMPSLNVAKYIEACMESVLNQTIRDLEIIAIDAGSTDGTWEILQEYARKDPRIRLFHSDKKSYGYQINMGICLARGKYVGVVETDDYIEPDMYETLYQNAMSGNYDYVKGNALSFRKISKDIMVTSEIKCVNGDRVVLNPKEHPALFSTDRFLWLGLYKADFIKGIRLNETPGAAYQDIGFIFQVLNCASEALYLNKVIYYYRQDNMNASGYNKKAFQYLYDEYSSLLQRKISDDWYAAVYKKMLEQCLGRFHNMALSGEYWSEYSREIEILRGWLLQAEHDKIIDQKMMGEYNWNLFKLWQTGSDKVYQYCAKRYSDKNEKVKHCFRDIGGRDIIIFGAGKYGKFFHALSENKCPRKVVAYCDNNEKLVGTSLQGVKIIAPSKAAEIYPEAAFVISVYREAENVYKQLVGLGIGTERIVRYEPDCDSMLLNMKY